MATTTKAAKRTRTLARRPQVSHMGRETFLTLAQTMVRYQAELREHAAGKRGPVPAELASSLRTIADNTGAEFLGLVDYLADD